MKQGFRQTMAWLHTWVGLLSGAVLYFVFVTGTAGYFQIEISRWMRPELPLASPVPALSDMLREADRHLRREAAAAEWWSIELPLGRHGHDLRVSWSDGGAQGETRTHTRVIDWDTGLFREPPTARATGGGHALYVMHYRLHYVPRGVSVAIVGVCSMFLLVAIVSGLVVHRKILADLFTFRRGSGQRAWLDAHNIASVLALPFIVMITCSGLVFKMEDFLPAARGPLYGHEHRLLGAELYPQFGQPRPAHRAAGMLPLEHFVPEVRQHWGARAAPRRIRVINPGDAAARIEFWHAGTGTIRQEAREKLNFNAIDGRLLERITDTRSAPILAESTMAGLHEGLFAGPVLRWLYFGSGLLGCVMIATGLVLWSVKRRAKARPGSGRPFGHDLMERLNIGTIVGLPIAVAVYFWSNRILPVDLPNRAAWEMHSLFIGWSLMFGYVLVRPAPRGWAETLGIAAGAFGLLPVLNALTTSKHLGVTLAAGDWELAGFDLTVLALAVIFGATAVKVSMSMRAGHPMRRNIVLIPDAGRKVG